MNGVCDNCHQLTGIHFNEQNHPKGIRETHFECEQCGERFICFVTDDGVRMMQTRKERMTGLERVNDRLLIQEKINHRMTELKDELLSRRIRDS